MAELADGASAEVQGSTNWYTISRRGDVYSCTCPAWINQRLPIQQRTCKHIRAYLGGYALSSTAPLPGAPEYEEAPEVRAAREEVLTHALERYVVLYDKMEETFGLRMPEQLAYMAGFFLGLSNEERASVTDGPGLLGVATWFDAATTAEAIADERLRDRKRNDPAELVVALSRFEGVRYGFWYDDPKELPTATAVRASDARATTAVVEATLLRTLFDDLLVRTPVPYDDDGQPQPRNRIDLAVLSWIAEVARRELAAARGPSVARRVGINVSGVTPFVVRGWTAAEDLAGWLEVHKRLEAYIARSSEVNDWIAQGLQEIKDGAPGRALFLGQELHWLDAPEYRTETSELLVRAYGALGRRALADILRAQYLHFEPTVPVFELPPPHAIVNAASAGDATEIARALAEGAPPSDEEMAEALANATSVEAASALLDIEGADAQTDSALWRRLGDLTRDNTSSIPTTDIHTTRALVNLLVERGVVNARAYGRILAKRDDALIDLATGRVAIYSEDARGKTPLHLAAGAALPRAVRALLDRGADACSEDSAGQVPYQDARTAWRSHPHEAGEIFGMLEAAGGSPKAGYKSQEAQATDELLETARQALIHKPPPPTEEDFEWSDGIEVTHARFGEGVVEEVLGGEGDETKMKIRFEKETRVLLAKFVKRVVSSSAPS